MSRTFTPYTGVGGKRTQEREGLNRLDDQHELASPDLMWAEIGKRAVEEVSRRTIF